MSGWVRLFELVTLVFLGAPSSTSTPRELYLVDLQRVIPSTKAGEAARTELARRHSELTRGVEGLAEQVRAERDKATRSGEAKDQERARQREAEYERALSAGQDEIERLEKTKLAPILADLRARITGHNRDEPEARVLSLDTLPVIDIPEHCDRTDELALAVRSGRAWKVRRDGRCAVRELVRIDYRRALRQSKAGVEAAKRIEAFRKVRQGELDELQARRARATLARDRAGLEQELLERYSSLQTALGQMEESEETRLYERLDAAVRRVSSSLQGVWIIDASAPVDGLPLDQCDATSWGSGVLDGASGATSELSKICPNVGSKTE